jgi:hypothetical protein
VLLSYSLRQHDLAFRRQLGGFHGLMVRHGKTRVNAGGAGANPQCAGLDLQV